MGFSPERPLGNRAFMHAFDFKKNSFVFERGRKARACDMRMNIPDYEKCARRIAEALQLTSGETVLLKLDPRLFSPLIAPLQKAIRSAGSHISGVVLAEDSDIPSPGELESLRSIFG